MLRTPSVVDSTGGAISEVQARERGRMVKTADQMAQLAYENGLKVSDGITKALDEVLLPTPALGHIRNYDEPVEDYLERRAKAESGEYRGMPGISLGVALRMELMPTPNTMEHLPARTGEARERQLHRGGSNSRRSSSGNLREDILDLMPTPAARDWKDGSSAHQRDGVIQTDTVARAIFNSGEVDLLPTPLVDDSKNTGHNQTRIKTLASEVWETERTTTWGKFEPAIRRWEQTIGRPAPAPTKPDGKDGSHRLSSKFTEWMMGLPDGWITDAGLTRNEELKACGNGVVPQQAALALKMLIQGIPLTTNGGGGQVNLPTPTVSDTFTSNLKSSQQKDGSMHSVTLPQAVERLVN